MNLTKHIFYVGLPVAASLFLGGCESPTSGKNEASLGSDKTALAASISVSWSLKTGLASSIGVGAAGTVSITGTDNQANGSHSVYRWNGSGWSATTGTGFETDVGASGSLWIIGSDSKIWKSIDNGSSWAGQNNFTVSDIGVSSNGYVWALGTGYIPGTSDHPIYRLDNGTGNWVQTGGGGVRIDVDGNGLPYVVNANNDIYQGNSDGSFFGLFTSGKAIDIGVGSNGTVWIIGTNTVGANGDKGIYKWDGSSWQQANGGAKRISVGSDGKPWIVNSNGAIYQGL